MFEGWKWVLRAKVLRRLLSFKLNSYSLSSCWTTAQKYLAKPERMKSSCPSLECFSQWDVCQSLWRAQGGNWHALHCSSQSWMLHGTWATNRKFSETEGRPGRMSGECVPLAPKDLAWLCRYLNNKGKSADLAIWSHIDVSVHVSEVSEIPPPLCLTSGNSFSGDRALCIHQWQVAHEWTESA